LCRNVALVVGVVALFISGPIGWALVAVAVAAAAVAFYDDVGRYANGEIGLGQLGLSALGLIPFAPGGVRLAQVGLRLAAMGRGLRAGGELLAAGGRAARSAIPAIRNGIGSLRSAAGTVAENAWRFVTDPIDPVTGDMLLAQLDLTRDGVLPVQLDRVHRSSYRCGRWFGPSWASSLDQRVELDGGSAFVALADGTLLVYPVPEPGGPAVLPEYGPRLQLAATMQGTWLLSDPHTGRVLHFAATGAPDPGVYPVQRITDAHGNVIDWIYQGNELVEVRHGGGYRVRIETTGGLVTALLADRGDGTLIAVRRFGYDSARRLTQVYDADGSAQVFDYDDAGRITRWQDRIGTWYRYEYDHLGRAVRTQGADHCMDAVLEYGETTRRWTNSLGQVTSYHVADGQPTRITDPLGHETSFDWDHRGRLRQRTDPLGRTTGYEYDDHDDLIAVIRPDGTRCEARYHAPGRPELVREPDGAESRWTFDEHGNLLSSTDPTGARTEYRYDRHGAPTAVIDPLGGTTLIRNDAAGLPVEVTDPIGAVTRIRRDATGQAIEVIDPLGHAVTFTWTPDGELATRVLPDGASERWSYDGEGNLVEHVDAVGGRTRFEIGRFDTTSARTTPDGARIAMAYDTELRPVAIIDARGLQWQYEYDAAGRVVREIDYDGRILSYRYDAAGQLLARTNGAGETVEFVRDRLGQVVEEHAGDRRTSYTYDIAGRLLRAVNADADLVFDRDVLGRIVAETCDGRVVSSTYDAAGQRVARQTPSGLRSRWNFDAAGRPVTLDSGTASLSFSWDDGGREIERRLGAATLRQSWDPTSRLTSQALSGSGSARERRFRYRADGYLTGAGDRRFELDAVGRVVHVSGDGGPERYRYDAAGGVTNARGASVGDTTGDHEFQGTRVRRAGRTHYSYDAQGRLTLRRIRLLSGGTRDWRFGWDAQDRLITLSTPEGTHWRYRYDALGRRVAKERLALDGAVVERVDFSWDGALPAEQRTGTRVTTWDFDPTDLKPLAQHERNSQDERHQQDDVDQRFYAIVTDLVGTPTELVDESGNVLPERTSLWGAAAGGSRTPLRMPGQYADEESGLHYNLFRYYDPATGEYVSADPLGLEAGFNNRHYVPNPLHWLDPFGLLSCAQLLRNSMTAAGRAPGPGQAAAHVVASGGSLRQWAPAAQARKLLARYGVDINTAENGMRLNHPIPHNFTHRGPFHIRVRDNLSNLASSMSAAGHTKKQIGAALKQRLADIGQQVEAELATGSPAPGAFWTGP
ncbi:MAG TPA: RHS repeat-associated core domain-containing protein, partial [Kineosporiaceae bacterium]|nr:RHS repeat-associated core domain-containing protein [Kineosporiaceae bacterium]